MSALNLNCRPAAWHTTVTHWRWLGNL